MTGSAGFIGRRLFREILNKEPSTTEVHGLDRNKGYRGSVSIQKDIQDMKVSDFKKYDVIYHLAAMTDVNECEGDPEQCWKDNLKTVEKIVKSNPKLLVYTTSVAALLQHNEYGRSKFAAENFITDEMDDSNYVMFRMTNVYGPNGQGVINKWLDEKDTVSIYGNGRVYRDFVFLEDVINYISLAPHLEKGKIYNVCSGRLITINALAKIFMNTFDRSKILRKPKRDCDILTSPSPTEENWLRCNIQLEEGFNRLRKRIT